MQEIFGKIRDEVAFTSLRRIAASVSAPINDRLGGDCHWLSEEIVKQLKATGMAGGFLQAKNCIHTAAVGKDGKEAWYFDASVMHHGEPVSLTAIAKSGTAKVFPAYPHHKGNTAHMLVTPESRNTVSVAYHRLNGDVATVYLYDLRKITDTPGTNGDPTPLLRVLMDDKSLRTLHLDRANKLIAGEIGGKKEKEYGIKTADPDFVDGVIEAISTQLQLSPDDILGAFATAKQIRMADSLDHFRA